MESNVTPVGRFASFRDPDARVLVDDQRVLRFVTRNGDAALDEFLRTPAARRHMDDGSLVHTTRLDASPSSLATSELNPSAFADAAWEAVYEHTRIEIPSFPSEWTPGMLHDAGALTLELASATLGIGWGLKDATPYNVLFDGTRPVFVDLSSFERRTPGSDIWLPHAQFSRTFMLPLLASRYNALPIRRAFALGPDGLSPEEVYGMTSPLRRLAPSMLGAVTVPALLGRRERSERGAQAVARSVDPERARWVLGASFRRWIRALAKLRPVQRSSAWRSYVDDVHEAAYHTWKSDFISGLVAREGIRRVLDIGTNTGRVAMSAACAGARVVAIDRDEASVEALYQTAKADRLDVLPLVVDIAEPTPRTGWLARERAAFLDRMRGKSDLVVLYAVLHHLLVSARVPIEKIVDLAAELTTHFAVIEFVPPDDQMFARMARGRDALFTGVTEAAFRSACERRFAIRTAHLVPASRRTVFLLERDGR